MLAEAEAADANRVVGVTMETCSPSAAAAAAAAAADDDDDADDNVGSF